ncbi:NUDIX hydrolase [Patescibacteria group bacterium]|nr:NUDIX hydrolase [Patescibacteria group bacterium]
MVPINKEKKILLQHREPGILIKPDHWAFFGGHIEDGENEEDAVKREFQEELGVAEEFPKFFKHDFTRERIQNKEEIVERFFYVMAFDGNESDLRKQLREGDNLGFFSRDELETLRMVSNDREICYEIFDVIDTLL